MSDELEKLNFDNSIAGAKELKKTLDDVKKTTEGELSNAMEGLGEHMGSVFRSAARDGKISADEIGKAFLNMAHNILMEQVFSKIGPFGNLFGDVLGGLLGGLAGGGTIQPNGPTLVGERGPELFIPNTTGRIANNHDTGNILGSKPVIVNQTINIEPTTQKDLVAMIHASRPIMQEDAKRAVMEAMNGIRY